MRKPVMRFLSLVLTLTLLLNMLPPGAFAAENSPLEPLAEFAEEAAEVPFPEELEEISLETPEEISLAVPVEALVLAGTDTGEGTVLYERTDLRTENSKDFLLTNGQYAKVIYPEPIHFRSGDRWEQIDNTLKEADIRSGRVYTNTAGSWSVRFPQDLTAGKDIQVVSGEHTLGFRLTGEIRRDSAPAEKQTGLLTAAQAQAVLGEVSREESLSLSQPQTAAARVVTHTAADLSHDREKDLDAVLAEKLYSRLDYEEIYTNTDIRFELGASRLKESLVLKSYDPNLWGYTYLLDAGDMEALIRADGSIGFTDRDGREVMEILAPYLVDSAGAICEAVEVRLEESGEGSYVLSYLLPRQWLGAAQRQWPVTLDPDIVQQMEKAATQEKNIYSLGVTSTPSSNLHCGLSMVFGAMRFYLKYNDLPQLTSADIIVSATLRMMKPTSSGSSLVEVHNVTHSWTPDTLTWSNQNVSPNNILDYQNCSASGFYTWDITNAVHQWYDGTNHGLMFKASDATEGAGIQNELVFRPSAYTVYTTHRPTLVITYRNHNGLEDYWDYTTLSAGRAGSGYINNYTGHLVWVRDELGFGGNRMSVAVRRIYNANDCKSNLFGMGYGWRTNYNQRVYPLGTDAVPTYYVWEDADGTAHYFKSGSGGLYRDEDGLELTLDPNLTGSYRYSITDKLGNKSYFDSLGRLVKLENNQATKSSIQITYTDSTNFYIKEITDGVGRRYGFTYYASNTLSRLSYYGSGTGEIAWVGYAYQKGMLTSVKYQDRANMDEPSFTTYSYTTNNHISTVMDVDGYQLTLEYNQIQEGKPSRVRKVTEQDGSVQGRVLSISYIKNQTTFTDNTGNTEIHQFSNWGNTVSVSDGLGRARFSKFAYHDMTETGQPILANIDYDNPKSNQLRLTSRLQNTVGNLFSNSSFESAANWTATDAAVTCSSWSHTLAYAGSKFLRIQNTGTGTQGAASPGFTVEAGKSYTFSAYVYSGNCQPYLSLSLGTQQAVSTAAPADSTWTRLEVTLTAASSGTLTAKILLPGSGTVFADCVQLEKASSASRYNLVQNGDFRDSSGWSSSSGILSLSQGDAAPAQELDSKAIRLNGSPASTSRVTQTVAVSGSDGDRFVLAAWAKGRSVPLSDYRLFSVVATFQYTDGTTSQAQGITFNPDVQQWQYAAGDIQAEGAYSGITLTLAYDYNAREAYFDGIQLFREEFGTRYQYDADGNVTDLTDPQGSAKLVYDSAANLTKITEHLGGTDYVTEYTYDSYHNVTSATTHLDVTYTFTYDSWGNNTAVKIGGITASSAYSSDGNRLVSTTDNSGATTRFDYDPDTNLLRWVQYPMDSEAQRTTYTYDPDSFRLTAVGKSYDSTTLTAGYGYTEEDTLASLTTGSGVYTFQYGDFSLPASVKIGSRTLASYSYSAAAHDLTALTYGNGDSVSYSYDTQGRVTGQTYEDGDTVTYLYNNDGILSQVTDSASGRTDRYLYDLHGRLAQYTQTGSGLDHRVTYGYDSRGLLAESNLSVFGGSWDITYSYDGDGRMTGSGLGNATNGYTYDTAGRPKTKTTVRNSNTLLTDTYTYYANTTRISRINRVGPKINTTLGYSYDGNGNITAVSTQSGDTTQTTTYVYDRANQLIRENNQAEGKTWTWTYDNAGNITQRKEYAYTTGSLGNHTAAVNYSYGDDGWKDLLTSYDGQSITYDTIGNPTSYYNGTRWSMTWEHGRQLVTMSDGGTTWTNTYGGDGLRTGRSSSNGVSYSYAYDGGQLAAVQRTDNGSTLNMWIVYDSSGPVTIKYGSGTFRYVLNQQGDVIALLDSSGEAVVEYTYDAWGNVLSISGKYDYNLGIHNPLRYRGYVYDEETGLYYVSSRYYDPEIGRFINADSLVSTGQGMLGNNMFAYCLNNPVNHVDRNGTSAEALQWWTTGMGWLPFIDTALPFGDIIYGVGILIISVYALTVVDDTELPQIYWEEGNNDTSEKGEVTTGKPPTEKDGYRAPKGGAKKGKTKDGKTGWVDKGGNIWVPAPTGSPIAHGGGHWDVQRGDGKGYSNVYPGGRVRPGSGRSPIIPPIKRLPY